MVTCRTCKNSDLKKFLSLGDSPLANNFLSKEQVGSEEFFPLDLYFCDKCGLVQLGYVVPAEKMYSNYLYIPSTSETLVTHFAQMADDIIERFQLSSNDMVVDVGGNDGTLLKNFLNHGIRTLNVEPADNIAKISEEAGIETVVDYFNEETARRIGEKMGKTKVIIGTNVFTHIDDLDSFLKGVDVLLDGNGVLVVEVYYLGDLIQHKSFDIVYHEHLSYFTAYSLDQLFKRYNLHLFDVKKIPVHGGSLRVFVSKPGAYEKSASVDEMINLERNSGLTSLEAYANFADNVALIKQNVLSLIEKLKSEGKRIVGYGAPAKSTTLLNYFGIGKEILEYIVDKSPLKQNRYTPGTHIPIYPPEKLLEDKPDYVLILAWNIADEIIKQQSKYKELGGKFIIPIPEPVIV